MCAPRKWSPLNSRPKCHAPGTARVQSDGAARVGPSAGPPGRGLAALQGPSRRHEPAASEHWTMGRRFDWRHLLQHQARVAPTREARRPKDPIHSKAPRPRAVSAQASHHRIRRTQAGRRPQKTTSATPCPIQAPRRTRIAVQRKGQEARASTQARTMNGASIPFRARDSPSPPAAPRTAPPPARPCASSPRPRRST